MRESEQCTIGLTGHPPTEHTIENMMEQYEDELSEIIVYVSSLRRTFNRKLDDHLFIIEQQRERIELQQHLFDEQRTVIDELAWQIRDLRDSVRQCCEKMAEFEMNQTRRNNEAATSSAVHSADYDNADNHSRGRLQRQGHVVLEGNFSYNFFLEH